LVFQIIDCFTEVSEIASFQALPGEKANTICTVINAGIYNRFNPELSYMSQVQTSI
jgi:hypothetical protein